MPGMDAEARSKLPLSLHSTLASSSSASKNATALGILPTSLLTYEYHPI